MKQGVVGLKAVCGLDAKVSGLEMTRVWFVKVLVLVARHFVKVLAGLDLVTLTQSFGLGLGDKVLFDLFGTSTQEIKIVYLNLLRQC